MTRKLNKNDVEESTKALGANVINNVVPSNKTFLPVNTPGVTERPGSIVPCPTTTGLKIDNGKSGPNEKVTSSPAFKNEFGLAVNGSSGIKVTRTPVCVYM